MAGAIRIPTFDDLVAVYDDLVDLTQAGEFDSDMGEWASRGVDRAKAVLHALHPQFGFDKWSTVELKAARLLVGLVLTHPLRDGNKRLSIFAMHDLLLQNGFQLDTSDEDIEVNVVAVIEAKHAQVPFDRVVEIVADWIAHDIHALQ